MCRVNKLSYCVVLFEKLLTIQNGLAEKGTRDTLTKNYKRSENFCKSLVLTLTITGWYHRLQRHGSSKNVVPRLFNKLQRFERVQKLMSRKFSKEDIQEDL